MAHADVKAVSFTGGTATGSQVGVAAAQRFAKASLELGGKNATVSAQGSAQAAEVDGVVPVDLWGGGGEIGRVIAREGASPVGA